MGRILGILTAVAALLATAAEDPAIAAYLAAQENLPLIERSDWVNVKTDVAPAAVGDGVADDTAALQAALSMLEGKQPRTRAVYLPPGTYRITATLTVTQVQGGAVYGHGRATTIVWDGPEGTPTETSMGATVIVGARMFHSNGFGRNLYFGLTWDGRGKAAVGVDHDSKGYYETRVRHQYCAFRNFTDSGIRVGHDQKTASAEMMFYDCQFTNCARGVTFLAFNDYDNAIVRCLFRGCGTGVYCWRGNVYVRDCDFQGSTEEDLLLPPHSHSVRRCTSVGAGAFVRASQPGGYAQNLAIAGCDVRGWRDPAGAVQLANRGPVLIFDSVFADPAAPESPAIHQVGRKIDQTLVTANVVGSVVNDTDQARVTDIPRQRPVLMATAGAARWRHRPTLPTRIFDAQADFGAAGNGVPDDSPAIQAAIDAAVAHGNGAEAYLPAGTYRIEQTLNLGSGRLAGPIGRRTVLQWGRDDGGTIIRAHNPNGAMLSQLFFAAPDDVDVTAVHVTADGPGSIVLDGIWAGGSHQPRFRGTHLDHLPAGFVVTSPHLDGELTIDHCGDATVVLDYYFVGYAAPITIRGPTGSGFIGVHSAAGSHNDPDVTVLDNASIVFGDFYTEQTLGSLYAAGQPGQPPGRVTLSYAKLAARQPGIVTLAGYAGQVTVSRANMMYRPGLNAAGQPVKVGEKAVEIGDESAVLPLVGRDDTTVLLLANSYKTGAPTCETKDAHVFMLGGNVWRGGPTREDEFVLPDSPMTPALVDAVNVALDHWHELSRHALDQ